MKVTLREIADAVEMSVSTVSRALNGHPSISEESAGRIREVAREFQYQRRKSHRRLDPARELAGRNIAMVTLGLDRALMTLPTMAAAVNGVEAALSEAGCSFRLAHVPDPAATAVRLDKLAPDGLILLGADAGDHASIDPKRVARFALENSRCLGHRTA